MSGIDQLLAVARVYASVEGIDLSTVSWRVFGDTKKLKAMEQGADIQVRRYEGAMTWFSAHWPKNARWPKGIARPSSAERVGAA